MQKGVNLNLNHTRMEESVPKLEKASLKNPEK